MEKRILSWVKKRSFATGFLFWIHLPFVLIWFGLFFIPSSLWSDRVVFHFCYVLSITIIHFLLFFILSPKIKKIDFICPLTTWTQSFRGYPVKDKRNYAHSFIAELLKKVRINVSFKSVDILMLISFFIVIVQYILF